VESAVLERTAGREGLMEFREADAETVDVARGLDVVFVFVRTGKGNINSLSLEFFSVTHVIAEEAA
jgi:hypothetical protein